MASAMTRTISSFIAGLGTGASNEMGRDESCRFHHAVTTEVVTTNI
jgi:hypothetical protein